jgi:hypothetical protein
MMATVCSCGGFFVAIGVMIGVLPSTGYGFYIVALYLLRYRFRYIADIVVRR